MIRLAHLRFLLKPSMLKLLVFVLLPVTIGVAWRHLRARVRRVFVGDDQQHEHRNG